MFFALLKSILYKFDPSRFITEAFFTLHSLLCVSIGCIAGFETDSYVVLIIMVIKKILFLISSTRLILFLFFHPAQA